jgi:hypothetical protein
MNIIEKLRAVAKKRSLTQREVRAFVRGEAKMLSADELRSICEDTTADEKLRAQARAQLAMLQQ